MFSLTIVFGPGPMVWTLMFKNGEEATRAKRLADNFSTDNLHLVDDFGQNCTITGKDIHGTMLEDLEQSKFAHIYRALHQTKTKIDADKMMDSDPAIKEAARRAQSNMPMIQPMSAGFGPNGRFPS
jgi:biopolymer transport protein ExbB/TolQ